MSFSELVTRLGQDTKMGKCSEQLSMPWNLAAMELLELIKRYPAGLSITSIRQELHDKFKRAAPGWKRKTERTDSSKKITVDVLFKSHSLSSDWVLDITVKYCKKIGNAPLLTVTDGVKEIDMIVHQRYFNYYNFCMKKNTNGRRLLLVRLNTTRIGRKKCILPGEYMIPVMDPTKFPDDIKFMNNFQPSISVLQETVDGDHKKHAQFRGVISEIGSERATREESEGAGHGRRRRITLTDEENHDVSFVLYDDQVNLVNMFDKGDTLLIHGPKVEQEGVNFVLRYAHLTELFLLPRSGESNTEMQTNDEHTQLAQDPNEKAPQQDSEMQDDILTMSTQLRLKQTAKHDLEYNHKRILFKDIPDNASNVAVLATVVSLHENQMHILPGTTKNRECSKVVLRDDDETEISAYFHGDTPEEVEGFLPGHRVFISGFTGEDDIDFSSSSFKMNIQVYCGLAGQSTPRIYNLNRYPGYLASPSLFQLTPIRDAPEVGLFVTMASIQTITFDYNGLENIVHKRVTPLRHSTTLSRIPEDGDGKRLFGETDEKGDPDAVKVDPRFPMAFSPNKRRAVSAVKSVFTDVLGLSLKDDSGMMEARCSPHATAVLLGCNASDFSKQTREQQGAAIKSLEGRDMLLLVTALESKSYRIELSSASDGYKHFAKLSVPGVNTLWMNGSCE